MLYIWPKSTVCLYCMWIHKPHVNWCFTYDITCGIVVSHAVSNISLWKCNGFISGDFRHGKERRELHRPPCKFFTFGTVLHVRNMLNVYYMWYIDDAKAFFVTSKSEKHGCKEYNRWWLNPMSPLQLQGPGFVAHRHSLMVWLGHLSRTGAISDTRAFLSMNSQILLTLIPVLLVHALIRKWNWMHFSYKGGQLRNHPTNESYNSDPEEWINQWPRI